MVDTCTISFMCCPCVYDKGSFGQPVGLLQDWCWRGSYTRLWRKTCWSIRLLQILLLVLLVVVVVVVVIVFIVVILTVSWFDETEEDVEENLGRMKMEYCARLDKLNLPSLEYQTFVADWVLTLAYKIVFGLTCVDLNVHFYLIGSENARIRGNPYKIDVNQCRFNVRKTFLVSALLSLGIVCPSCYPWRPRLSSGCHQRLRPAPHFWHSKGGPSFTFFISRTADLTQSVQTISRRLRRAVHQF